MVPWYIKVQMMSFKTFNIKCFLNRLLKHSKFDAYFTEISRLSQSCVPQYLKVLSPVANLYLDDWILTMGLQRKQEWQNTWSTIVSILSESHQDPSATETFFWTCYFPLWCNSCCSDPRIVYKCCLYNGNIVAKDSGVVTTNRSCPVYVNKRQGTRSMLDTW